MFYGMSESMRYIDELEREERLWFLDDVVEAAKRCRLFDDEASLQAIALRVEEINDMYESNGEDKYYNALQGRGRRKLITLFQRFCEKAPERIADMGRSYALEIADRILHDRQLCNFIAQTVMDIGFDGETEKGMRKQWVHREKWPEAVKSILRVRDRGKCANCGADIVHEGHIDHMFRSGEAAVMIW